MRRQVLLYSIFVLAASCSKEYVIDNQPTPDSSIHFDGWKILPSTIGKNYSYYKASIIENRLYFFSKTNVLAIDQSHSEQMSVAYDKYNHQMDIFNLRIQLGADYFGYCHQQDIYIGKISNPKIYIRIKRTDYDTISSWGLFGGGLNYNKFYISKENKVYFDLQSDSLGHLKFAYLISDNGNSIQLTPTDTLDIGDFWGLSTENGKYYYSTLGTYFLDNNFNKRQIISSPGNDILEDDFSGNSQKFLVRNTGGLGMVIMRNYQLEEVIPLVDSNGQVSMAFTPYIYKSSVYFSQNHRVWEFNFVEKKFKFIKGQFEESVFDMIIYGDKFYVLTTSGIFYKNVSDLHKF